MFSNGVKLVEVELWYTMLCVEALAAVSGKNTDGIDDARCSSLGDSRF